MHIEQNLRICDNRECENTVPPIQGDGSVPYVSSPTMGGLYFCSYECRSAHLSEEDTPHELLTKVFVDTGLPFAASWASSLAHYLIRVCSPTVEEFDYSSPEYHTRRFAVTNSPLTSLLACIMSGDQHLNAHTGPNGTEQTLPRIGSFAAVVSIVHPKAYLYEIDRLRILKPVPLGTTIIITCIQQGETIQTRWGEYKQLQMQAHSQAGTALCRPALVTTWKPV